jgi:hypothetical protein
VRLRFRADDARGIAGVYSKGRVLAHEVSGDEVTLDAELPSFIDLEPTLREMGIGLLLPTREQLDLRSKGLVIDPEDIFAADRPSLIFAIVSVGATGSTARSGASPARRAW